MVLKNNKNFNQKRRDFKIESENEKEKQLENVLKEIRNLQNEVSLKQSKLRIKIELYLRSFIWNE